MESPVQHFCSLLVSSRLVSPREVRKLHHRWQQRAGDGAADLDSFLKWLQAEGYVTSYHVERLLHGHTGNFFLGPYKILERIAQGSMTRVYKAKRSYGATVALKVLPPSRAEDPELLARFRRETRAARRLKHPNVVRTIESGTAGGLHFLVLEYLDGETLENVLRRRGRLPWPEAIRLFFQALQGLQYLHEQGLVHGNLEPANLMLVSPRKLDPPDTTERATVKILDIGLGRRLFKEIAEATATDLRLNGEGVLRGHLEYLAPEQARNPGGSDIRADIYSLGCVLYRCLTGKLPFSDRSGVHQVLRHATEAPRPVKEFDPEIPAWLQQVIDTMMAKDPAQRYPTPKDAVQALRGSLGTKAELLAPPTSRPRSLLGLRASASWSMQRQDEQAAENDPTPPSLDESAESLIPPTPATRRPGPSVRPLSPVKLLVAVVLGALPSVLGYLAWTRFRAAPEASEGKVVVVRNQTRADAKGAQNLSTATKKPKQQATPTAKTTVPVAQQALPPRPNLQEDNATTEKPNEEPAVPPKEKTPLPEKKSSEEQPASQSTLPKPIPRLPVPTDARQATAEKLVKEIFQAEYANRTPADRRALAVKLLRLGKETRDDLDARFVLFREARDLASQAGDLVTAFQAVDALAGEYAVDGLKQKVAALTAVNHALNTAAAGKSVAETAVGLVEEAVAADDYEEAFRALAIATDAARRAHLAALVRRIDSRSKEVAEVKEEYQRVQLVAGALEKIRVTGKDMAADQEYLFVQGRFLCFLKGDWPAGLPLLVRGSNAKLKALAQLDLAPEKGSLALVKLADRWWELAEDESCMAKKQIQRRACHWYRQALPDLAGLTRTRVERRLALVTD